MAQEKKVATRDAVDSAIKLVPRKDKEGKLYHAITIEGSARAVDVRSAEALLRILREHGGERVAERLRIVTERKRALDGGAGSGAESVV